MRSVDIKLCISTGFVLLAVILAVVQKSGYGVLIVCGVVCSWFGDMTLADFRPISRFFKDRFIAGMGFFAVTHCFFIAAFVLMLQGYPMQIVLFGALGYLVLMAVVLVRCFKRGSFARELKIAMVGYAFLISGMASFALALGVQLGGWYVLAAIGALFFVISDAMIIVDMSGRTIPKKDFWIWLTYAVAQILIVVTI